MGKQANFNNNGAREIKVGSFDSVEDNERRLFCVVFVEIATRFATYGYFTETK